MNTNTTTKALQIAAGLGIAMLLGSGLGRAQDVKYNSMPGTNFAKYHTYKWVDCGGKHPGQITDQEIIQAVDGQLSQKGFSKVTGEDADMFVCYQIAVDQEKQWNAFGMGRFAGMGSVTSSTISNGTMVLDFYDAPAKQQIWQGTATKTLDPSGNEQKNIKSLNTGIAKLMKNFPPIVKK